MYGNPELVPPGHDAEMNTVYVWKTLERLQ